MRGCSAWVGGGSPRGAFLTLRAEAVLVEGDPYELFEELVVTRFATQYIIDALWGLDKLPSLNEVHRAFYSWLRGLGFRAHQAKQVYKYALALVKSAKANRGSKPVIRCLSARLDRYDASVDFDNWVITLKMRNRTFRLKLLHNREYLEKFRGREWYEVVVKWLPGGRIVVAIPFRFGEPRREYSRVLALDINLRQLVLFDGERIRRIGTRFVEALRLRDLAEDVQRRHPRTWRRNRKLLGLISSLHRRSRNIVLDWSRKTAKVIVEKAARVGAAVAVEDLVGLWHRASTEDRCTARALARFAYRKLVTAIEAKCIELGVPLIIVDPRGTSTTCPRCGTKLEYVHRLGHCPGCGYTADRDATAAVNIHARAHRAPPPGVGGAPGQ